MHVVGDHKLDIVFFSVNTQIFVYFELFFEKVVLHFEVKIIPEKVFEPYHEPFRFVEISV